MNITFERGMFFYHHLLNVTFVTPPIESVMLPSVNPEYTLSISMGEEWLWKELA